MGTYIKPKTVRRKRLPNGIERESTHFQPLYSALNKRRSKKNNPAYHDDDIIRAMIHYAKTGNVAEACTKYSIHPNTYNTWIHTEWYKEAYAHIKAMLQDQLDAKLTGIVISLADEITDRLENGDAAIVNGEVISIPVKSRDLAFVLKTVYEKRALIRGEPTSNASKVSADEIVNRLAKKFEEIGERNREKIVSEQ